MDLEKVHTKSFRKLFLQLEDFSDVACETYPEYELEDICEHTGFSSKELLHLLVQHPVVGTRLENGEILKPEYRLMRFPIPRIPEKGCLNELMIWLFTIAGMVLILIFAPAMVDGTIQNRAPVGVITMRVGLILIVWSAFILGLMRGLYKSNTFGASIFKRIHRPSEDWRVIAVKQFYEKHFDRIRLRGWHLKHGDAEFGNRQIQQLEGFNNSINLRKPELYWALQRGDESFVAPRYTRSIQPWPEIADGKVVSGFEYRHSGKCQVCGGGTEDGIDAMMFKRDRVEDESHRRGLASWLGVLRIPICKSCSKNLTWWEPAKHGFYDPDFLRGTPSFSKYLERGIEGFMVRKPVAFHLKKYTPVKAALDAGWKPIVNLDNNLVTMTGGLRKFLESYWDSDTSLQLVYINRISLDRLIEAPFDDVELLFREDRARQDRMMTDHRSTHFRPRSEAVEGDNVREHSVEKPVEESEAEDHRYFHSPGDIADVFDELDGDEDSEGHQHKE